MWYEKCFATLLCKNGLSGLSPYVFPIQRFFALLRFDWKVHKSVFGLTRGGLVITKTFVLTRFCWIRFHFFHCIGRMPWRKSELIHYILRIVLEYKSSPDHSILEMPPLGSNHYSILEAAGHSPAFQSSQFLIPPPTLSISLPHNIYKYMEYSKGRIVSLHQ